MAPTAVGASAAADAMVGFVNKCTRVWRSKVFGEGGGMVQTARVNMIKNAFLESETMSP